MPHAGSDVVAAKAAQVVNGKRRIPCRRIRRNMKDEVKMDANRLIAEVYKRPALWNQRHISYHNRELTNRVWMEIADIFKLPKPVLKAKWKGLRDTFRAELKKEQVYRKSKYRRNRPLWIHFESLQFLKEQMLPRPGTWDRSTYDEDDCDGPQRHHENGLNSDDNDYQRDYHDDDLTEHLLRSSIARSMENYGQQSTDFNETGERYNDLEYHHIGSPVQRFDDSETMLQTLSPDHVLLNSNGRDGNGDSDSSVVMAPWTEPFDHRDENYYFFVSLLPHMKQLPAERKMYLRMKIQELVYEEVYKKSSTSMSTSTEKDNPTTP